MARKIDLAVHLPGGEWADIQIVSVPGMMAQHNWAILARARWLRGGGRAAFIKFIVKADAGAGSSTNLHTAAPRLEHLRDRLTAIKGHGSTLPVVPILVVELDAEGLLVAMAEVRPLQSLIESGGARKYAARVLFDLDPTAGHVPWLHFDLCGRNTGVAEDGRVVLIDLESLYLDDAGDYDVTVPAWKPFRSPVHLVRDVQMALAAGVGVPRALAERKTTFEVLLTAAECVLGPLRSRGRALDRVAVEVWLAPFIGVDPLAELLGNTILAFIDHGTLPRFADLAAEVERLLSHQEGTVAPVVVVENAGTVPIGGVAGAPAIAVSVEPQVVGAPLVPSVERQLLAPMGNALRAGRLDWEGIRGYGTALARIVEIDRRDREAWDELVLVLVAYEKDAARALEVLNKAVVEFPDDPEMLRMRTIVANWAMDKRR